MRIATLRRPTRGASVLFADPADTPEPTDGPAFRFRRTPEDVMAAWDRVVRAEPRTRVVAASPVTHHAVQRSALFRLPDDVYAEAHPAEDGTRLLVYAASRHRGGAPNAARVEAWVARLATTLAR